jgi:hypothetical protein
MRCLLGALTLNEKNLKFRVIHASRKFHSKQVLKVREKLWGEYLVSNTKGFDRKREKKL